MAYLGNRWLTTVLLQTEQQSSIEAYLFLARYFARNGRLVEAEQFASKVALSMGVLSRACI